MNRSSGGKNATSMDVLSLKVWGQYIKHDLTLFIEYNMVVNEEQSINVLQIKQQRAAHEISKHQEFAKRGAPFFVITITIANTLI